MKIAIVFVSPHGQTKKIAQQIKKNIIFESQFREQVHLVDLDATESLTFEAMDVFIIGFPVYFGKFPNKITKWVKEHYNELHLKRLVFFTVSLNAANPRPKAQEAENQLLEKFIEEVRLIPNFIALLGGAIYFTKYGFIKKFILKRISQLFGGPTDTAKDHELTNWCDVEEFSHAILKNDLKSHFAFNPQNTYTKSNNSENLKHIEN